MSNYGSRKFIVAVAICLIVVMIFLSTLYVLPVESIVIIMPQMLGFAGIVLGAVAVMYPMSNTLEAKWKNIK